jgi:hypothetical protein
MNGCVALQAVPLCTHAHLQRTGIRTLVVAGAAQAAPAGSPEGEAPAATLRTAARTGGRRPAEDACCCFAAVRAPCCRRIVEEKAISARGRVGGEFRAG